MKQLFKYLKTPRDLFSDGFIRLSQLSALNDPFEASYCRRSLSELVKHFDYQTAYDRELGEVDFAAYVESKMHHIGVISLSENKENLLMWSHYADEHRGLVAGILDIPEVGAIFSNLIEPHSLISSSFGRDWSPFDGKPKPVNYRKGLRYRNDKFDYDYSNVCAEGADRVLYEIFMQKSDEWIYEQEHRIVLRLEQADRVVLPNLDVVANLNIKKLIKKPSHTFFDSKNGVYVVNLCDFSDDTERAVAAIELAKLSKDPRVVFLMRLSLGAINCCLLGIKSSLNKSDLRGAYMRSNAYSNIWQARKNADYYCLEFEEIE